MTQYAALTANMPPRTATRNTLYHRPHLPRRALLSTRGAVGSFMVLTDSTDAGTRCDAPLQHCVPRRVVYDGMFNAEPPCYDSCQTCRPDRRLIPPPYHHTHPPPTLPPAYTFYLFLYHYRLDNRDVDWTLPRTRATRRIAVTGTQPMPVCALRVPCRVVDWTYGTHAAPSIRTTPAATPHYPLPAYANRMLRHRAVCQLPTDAAVCA